MKSSMKQKKTIGSRTESANRKARNGTASSSRNSLEREIKKEGMKKNKNTFNTVNSFLTHLQKDKLTGMPKKDVKVLVNYP